MRAAFCEALRAHLTLLLVCLLILSLMVQPLGAQTVTNGTSTGITTPGFLFEPEVPLASLKTAPTWNELEQLLDNPYAVKLCSQLTNAEVGGSLVANLLRGTPGNDQGYPSYCTLIHRRGAELGLGQTVFGVQLLPLLVDPLNYNPTTGEEMRLLNPAYGGGSFPVPVELVQCSDTGNSNYGSVAAACASHTSPANTWIWAYQMKSISNGARVGEEEAAIDYNAPIKPDPVTSPTLTPSIAQLQAICIATTEANPPEGDLLCGGDPGEPNYAGFGVLNAGGYSTPAVPGGQTIPAGSQFVNQPKASVVGLSLHDPSRGTITARDPSTGSGGLRKPSLRVPENTGGTGSPSNPAYLINAFSNVNPGGNQETLDNHVVASNENDYVKNRLEAMTLGKSLFWDMQVGSDSVQSCGTCHFNGTGTDTRTKNQVNPNHLGGDLTFQIHGGATPNSYDLTYADFPLHKLTNPDVAGDPACTNPIFANVNAGVLENNFPNGAVNVPVCAASNIVSDVNDVVSSMGVHFGRFHDIQLGLTTNSGGVGVVKADDRWPVGTLLGPVGQQSEANTDPIQGFHGTDGSFHQIRRVEPRNTPTMQAAGFNFDNFWDGRARHDFNGGSVFGVADPQSHVMVDDGGTIVPTRQVIKFSSIASLATGPGLSEFEMSRQGRNWAKVGKRLLQAGATPLANQLVAPTDSLLGRYSNQGGSACGGLAVNERSGGYLNGGPGLCISYNALIQRAYYPALWQNTSQHLNGCYTDTDFHPSSDAASPACPASVNFPDPFDGYVLVPAGGPAAASDTNQFTQMEGNFSLFWGLSIKTWVDILVPDDTPFDQFLDRNPDAFEALGEPGEPGLVGTLPNCTTATQRNCFRSFANFRRDNNLSAALCSSQGLTLAQCRGTRPGTSSTAPDPLLGMDIFFASNLSVKNPNFRTARCGECHAVPTLTDHTVPFTFKAQLRDFAAEFSIPGIELPIEPLGRLRTISGFLLESELGEPGQDGVERRIANQSIATCPTDGLAYPGGLEGTPGGLTGVDPLCNGAAAGYFDNGVYNLGVRPISEDGGRGGNDAFGWPLSLAALMLKNIDGASYEPGTALSNVDPENLNLTFEETAQDQQINPGVEGDQINPQLPAYLAPWLNQINVGDSAPELDEVFSGLNTKTDIGMLEGFLDTLGPFNPAGVNNESLNIGDTTLMGSWPVFNRVGRHGSFKAPQLRNVELTGPYFHNGGKLTLRQVVDFYTRGGDFPMTNASDRDFNMVNMNVEVQSNLREAEKVALVDFLLELTDDRNRFDRAPFDHPEVFVPLDGTAPENGSFAGADNNGRPGFLANIANGAFKQVLAVGQAGMGTAEPSFLNVTNVRVSGGNANPGAPQCNYTSGPVSQYCH